MITETEARELLARAASTIGEPPGELAVAPPQRPRWVAPLVAAAAIAAAVTTGLVLIHHDRHDDQPGPVAPTPDPYAGSVPPVFAYDGDSAQKMLEKRGLRVRRAVVTNRCEAPDRALRTKPDIGFPVEPGDTIRLYVTGQITAFCNPPELFAWRILDAANDRGPRPPIAADATFYVNGEQTTRTEAFDALASITKTFQPEDPVLSARYFTTPITCPEDDGAPHSVPERFAERPSYAISLGSDAPSDSIFTSCGPQVNVFRDAHHAIYALLIQAVPHLIHPPNDMPDRADPIIRGPLRRFTNFARGWTHHLYDNRSFGLYDSGSLVAVVDKRRSDNRSAYFLCPRSGQGRACSPSPIQLVGRLKASPTISKRATCFDGTGILPHVSGQATVLLTEPGVAPCNSSWVVQLDVDDNYQIVAVNEFEGPS